MREINAILGRQNMSPSIQNRKTRRGILAGKDGLRLAILSIASIVLLVIVFGGGVNLITRAILPEDQRAARESVLSEVQFHIPEIKMALLASVKEENASQRIIVEAAAYEHLIHVATQLYPATLRAMHLPGSAVPVESVRANPERFRGKPLFYEGTIRFLGQPQAVPELVNTFRTEGLLETEDKQMIVFAVIENVPEDLKRGSLARIEGLFFKLRDASFPVAYKYAPFLVGPSLRPAFKTFEAVTELDAGVLDLVADSNDKDAANINVEALYHLTSYVMGRAKEKISKPAPNLSEVEYKLFTSGDAADLRKLRGKPFRILGNLYHLQRTFAPSNPLGLEHWTKAWIYHPDVPNLEVRIPGRVEGDWERSEDVVVTGHFLQMHHWEVGQKLQGTTAFRTTPLFIADKIQHWKYVPNPQNTLIQGILGVITIFLILLFVFLVKRDSKAEKEVMEHLIERRKRRRAKSTRT